MNVDVRGDNVTVFEHTQVAIEKKCRLALGRISEEISDVRIVVHDENGPRRGIHLKCSVGIRMRSGAEIHAEAVAAIVHVAADRALERAARAAYRIVSRRHQFGRNSIRYYVDDAS